MPLRFYRSDDDGGGGDVTIFVLLISLYLPHRYIIVINIVTLTKLGLYLLCARVYVYTPVAAILLSSFLCSFRFCASVWPTRPRKGRVICYGGVCSSAIQPRRPLRPVPIYVLRRGRKLIFIFLSPDDRRVVLIIRTEYVR